MNEVIEMVMAQLSLVHWIYVTEVGLKQLQNANPSTKCLEKCLQAVSPMCVGVSNFP